MNVGKDRICLKKLSGNTAKNGNNLGQIVKIFLNEIFVFFSKSRTTSIVLILKANFEFLKFQSIFLFTHTNLNELDTLSRTYIHAYIKMNFKLSQHFASQYKEFQDVLQDATTCLKCFLFCR